MLHDGLIISAIYLFVALVYTMMGFFSLSLDGKKNLNRLFFILCLCASVWCICFSLSTAASGFDMALFYNKAAAFGWGTMYAFTVHFTKLLSNPNQKLSKTFYTINYLPMVLIIIVFAFLGDISNAQYGIVKSEYGWTTVTPPTILNQILNLYFFICSIACIINIIAWYKNIKFKEHIKSALKITLSLGILSNTMSILWDAVFIRLLFLELPQTTILWFCMPILALFYILVKNEDMTPDTNTDVVDEIDRNIKEKIFYVFGYLYILIDYFLLYSNHIIKFHDIDRQLLILVTLFVVAMAHFFLDKIFKKESQQYVFLVFVSSISMIVLSLIYIKSVSMTIWALFFSYILLTIVLRKIYYVYFLSFFMIIIQILFWINFPVIYVRIDYIHYIGRIMMILGTSTLIIYINYLYKKKTEEITLHVNKHQNFSDILPSILDVNVYNIEEKICEFLKNFNEIFSLKRSYYCRIVNNKIDTIYIQEGDFQETRHSFKGTVLELDKTYFEKMLDDEIVSILDIASFDDTYDKLKVAFHNRDITGFYAFPIFVSGALRGFSVHEFKVNKDNKMMLLYREYFRTIMIQSIKRVDSEVALLKKAHIDSLTGVNNRYRFDDFIKEKLTSDYNLLFLAIIDLNKFKDINDTYGHVEGDIALKNTVKIIQQSVEEDDFIARVGGDEFVVIGERSDISKVLDTSINIQNQMIKYNETSQKKYKLSVSIGYSVSTKENKRTSIELYKEADAMMYKNKNEYK